MIDTAQLKRIHHIIETLALLRDWPQYGALVGSLNRELTAISARQAEEKRMAPHAPNRELRR